LLLPEANQLDACFLFSNQSTRNVENVLVVFHGRISRADDRSGRPPRWLTGVDADSPDGAALRGDVFLLRAAEKAEEHDRMLKSLESGDEVVTTGSILA
jgi:hypothetical protein